jgi:dUTP pyrophosphatase
MKEEKVEYLGEGSALCTGVMLFDMTVKVKKLVDNAVIPNYAHDGDAGLDLYAVGSYTLAPGERVLVKTGIAIELPVHAEAQIRPRSGLALKHGITVLNAPGTVDAGYRGEVGVILINHGNETFNIAEGDKIAQMVVKPVYKINMEVVDELISAERAEKGFGSSGNK